MIRTLPSLLALVLAACGTETVPLETDTGVDPTDTDVTPTDTTTDPHTGHSDTAATSTPTDTAVHSDTATEPTDSTVGATDTSDTAPEGLVPWTLPGDSADWAGSTNCDSDLDTDGYPTGECSYVVEIVAGADFADMVVELTDAQGNVMLDVQAGDLTAEGTYYLQVTLPSNGYHLDLQDADPASDAWEAGASVRVMPASGTCLFEDQATDAYTVTEDGHEHAYMVLECASDTAWTPDSGFCEYYVDTASLPSGSCGYLLAVNAGADHADMQITIENSDGDEVYQLAAGDLTEAGLSYHPLNLPTDGYAITWTDEGADDAWASDAWFELVPMPAGETCPGLGAEGTTQYDLPSGHDGQRAAYVVLNCAEDSADTAFAWDSSWCEPDLPLDDVTTGACAYVLEVNAAYDYADMVIELTDADGNVVIDIQQGDVPSTGLHHYPVTLPSSGYHLHMEDASSWSTSWSGGAYARLVPVSQGCILEDEALESHRVSANHVFDLNFILQCDEDTADTFTWDSDWCEPVLDSATTPVGDCAYVVEVTADFDYAYMDIHLADSEGYTILDIDAGDLTAAGVTYYPVNLPTDGYTLTMKDTYPHFVSQWAANGQVRLIPVNAGCLDEELASEAFRVDYGGEEIVHFELDCADDTASFGWDSGWCDVIFPDTAALSGCEQLIEIDTYWGSEMGIEIVDSSGTLIFDIDPGDLAGYSAYLYTLEMPTGHYQLTLTDDGGNGWIDGGTWAPGSIAIWEGNGVCAGDNAFFGPYTLPDTNGDTDTSDNRQVFYMSVDCAADTSTDTEDTSWFSDSTWVPPLDTQAP